jgi:protein-S-isoprenylcysteine O-methyltransferase Ste14
VTRSNRFRRGTRDSGWALPVVRHPSYSGSIIGVACLTFNWLGFVVIIACLLVAYALRISVEEKVLFQSLGGEYRRYAERTKRLIPGIF